MKKNFNLYLISITIISFIGHLFIYNRLPDIVPIHWNINGAIDGYGPKYMDLVLAAIPILLFLGFIITPKIDPRGENYKKHRKTYNIVIFFTTLFLIALSWATAGVALGYSIDISKLVSIGIGILFLVIGNFMPKIRSNYTFGIKTPWTIENEWVWKKTHSIGGILFCVIGIIFIITSFTTNTILKILPLPMMLMVVAFLYVYSYIIYKKQ